MPIFFKIVIYCLNFSSVLSFSQKNRKLKVSKSLIVINFLLFPIIEILKWLPILSALAHLRKEYFSVHGLSAFLFGSLIVSSIVQRIVVVLVFYVQLWKQKKILKLIQNFGRLFVKFKLSTKSKEYQCFKRSCSAKLSILFLLILFSKCMNFYAVYNLSWESFLVYILTNFYRHISLCFLSLISLFISFFLLLLKHLTKKTAEICNQQGSINTRKVDQIYSEFSNLYTLLQDFDSIFATVLSINIAALIMMISTTASLLNS